MDVISLYNMALGKIGTRTTVSATSEGSNEANSCNVYYEQSRDASLRAAPWNFARKQALLTQLKASTDVPNVCPAPWGYEYALPSDCIRARFILPQVPVAQDVGSIPLTSSGAQVGPLQIMGPPVKFILGLDEDSGGNDIRVLLTNQYQAQLIYTRRIIDPNLFDPEFVEAFATLLASQIAVNITGDKELKVILLKEAKQKFLDAQATDGSEGLEVLNPTPDWIRGRGYVADWQPGGFQDFDQLLMIA